MKTKITLFILIVSFLSCSKSSDPAASAGGCSFTFKGTTYSLPVAPCAAVTATQFGATSANANQLLTLAKGGAIGTSALIIFSTDVRLGTTYGSSNTPTITIAGNTWTFSGTLANDDDPGDNGTISGKCTCSK